MNTNQVFKSLLLLVLFLFAILGCSTSSFTKMAPLTSSIDKLSIKSQNSIPNTLTRAFQNALPPHVTDLKSTVHKRWTLTLISFADKTNTIASSANAHMIVERRVATLCFSLKTPQGRLAINKTCLSQVTSYPFDSNEILSFEIQRQKHLSRLEKKLVRKVIHIINTSIIKSRQ